MLQMGRTFESMRRQLQLLDRALEALLIKSVLHDARLASGIHRLLRAAGEGKCRDDQ